MLVYRLCNELEFERVLTSKSIDGIGRIYNVNPKLNNHNYEPNQKYLHFYKDYGSLFYLYLKPGSYICTYDIPDELLEKYVGIGRYLDIEFMRKLENVIEYAIPNKELNFNYLKRIEKITDSIDFEEYLYDEHRDKLETVYDIEQIVLKKTRII